MSSSPLSDSPNSSKGESLSFLVRSPSDRLSLTTNTRIALAVAFNASLAFSTGYMEGSRIGGLRFLAENSHRMPKSQKGWFIYHRYKANAKLYNGLKTGLTRMLKWSIWPALFLETESMLDDVRGGNSKDMGSTIVAGVVTGGIYSLTSRQQWYTASKTLRTGFKIGLLLGISEDVLSLIQGRQLGYIEFAKRILGITSSGKTSDFFKTPE